MALKNIPYLFLPVRLVSGVRFQRLCSSFLTPNLKIWNKNGIKIPSLYTAIFTTIGQYFVEDGNVSRKRSRVQRFRGSRFHSCPRTAFGMHIYEKNVNFISSNPKFEVKLAITWENEHL